MLAAAELLFGLAIAAVTLSDVFASLLVPGRAHSRLHIMARVRQLAMPGWRWIQRRKGVPGRARLSNVFAPFLLVVAFGTWALLLLLAFGLMVHALGRLFSPEVATVSDAFWVAGSSLLTLGVSEFDAHGAARWVLLLCALSGFSVITATITFVLQVQTGLHQRESQVLTLSSMAGRPPTGLALLETFATLDLTTELPAFFREWRDWMAAVLHSHMAVPMLAHFHSVDSEGDWLSAMSVVLDASAMVVALTEHDARGAAVLMHRAGSRTAAHLCDLFELEPLTFEPVGSVELADVVARLERAGYPIAEGPQGSERLERARRDYAGRLAALARHLSADGTKLSPSF